MNNSIFNRIADFQDDQAREIKERISVSNDQFGEARRLEDMLRTEFPELPANTMTHRELAEIFIQNMVADLMKHRGNAPITVNVNTVIDSPGATINTAPSPEPQAEPKGTFRKLNWRSINDPSLSFEDRIIFSYAWKRAYFNSKQKQPKPVTLEYFRNATGFRPSTLNDSIERLKASGYLTEKWEPDMQDERVRVYRTKYRKLKWYRKSDGKGNRRDIRRLIFEAMMGYNENYFPNNVYGVAWYVKVLGVSRITAWRRLNKRVTDETSRVTVET